MSDSACPPTYSSPLAVVPSSGLSHFCHNENVIQRDVTLSNVIKRYQKTSYVNDFIRDIL